MEKKVENLGYAVLVTALGIVVGGYFMATFSANSYIAKAKSGFQ